MTSVKIQPPALDRVTRITLLRRRQIKHLPPEASPARVGSLRGNAPHSLTVAGECRELHHRGYYDNPLWCSLFQEICSKKKPSNIKGFERFCSWNRISKKKTLFQEKRGSVPRNFDVVFRQFLQEKKPAPQFDLQSGRTCDIMAIGNRCWKHRLRLKEVTTLITTNGIIAQVFWNFKSKM